MREEEAGVLDEARRLAATGPISPAGRGAFLGAAAASSGPPGVLVAALVRLAGQDRALGIHALAAAQRSATDASIRQAVPDRGELRPVPVSRPAPRPRFVTRSRA